MTTNRAPDYQKVVSTHWKRTTGILVASQQPCIAIRDSEANAVRGRALVAINLDELHGWVPPSSWILAVILCPGDDITILIDWVRRHSVDTNRIRFFLHPDTPEEILRPWHDAGHPTHRVDSVASWQRLHKLFGLALNDQVYEDWARASQQGGQ